MQYLPLAISLILHSIIFLELGVQEKLKVTSGQLVNQKYQVVLVNERKNKKNEDEKKQKAGVKEAELIGVIDPVYPLSARRRGWEGETTFQIVINANGSVDSLKNIIPSGHKALDDSARKAILEARFHPAELGGMKIESTKTLTFKYQLD